MTESIAITPWPKRAWERLAIDIRREDNTLGREYRFAVVVVDYDSKWAEVKLLSEITALKILEWLRKNFIVKALQR